MLRSGFPLLVLTLIATSVQAQVYRCTADGRTVYSQMPCAADERDVEKVQIFDRGPAEDDAAAARARAEGLRDRVSADREREQSQREFNRRVTNAIAAKKVFVGMTADDVRRSWGRPDRINRTVTGSTVSEQWIYDRGNYKSQYVYVRNGEVTSLQSPD